MKGFTLIEILTTTIIMVIIAVLSFLGIARAYQNAYDSKIQAELKTIYKAILLYQAHHGNYPSSLNQLESYVSITDWNKYQSNPNLGELI